MNSSLLEKARNYEKENIKTIPVEQRPTYHLSAPIGWINDPNGFSKYKGEIHLFYQYYPYETNWGPMHWGHAKSVDFIDWKYMPAAMAPDKQYDSIGVFSGSALEDGEKHILMYTGVEEIVLTDGKKEVRQNQCIAIGDGNDYEKLEANPVIKAELLPGGSSLIDFRDPKIWKEDDTYYAVVGSLHQDGSGQIALFSSQDLKDWKFCSILDRSKNRYGKMWECPDFFSLGEKHILVVSPQDMLAEGLEFHAGNGVMFLYGTYDKADTAFRREGVQSIDYGFDFYAPQTMQTEDGRRVMIAWMKSWETNLKPEEFKWGSMMTIPRELEYRNGRILQSPVRELEKYYQNKVEYHSVSVQEETQLEGIQGRNIDITVEIEPGDYNKFQIDFAKNDRFHSSLIYDKTEQVLTFDRTQAGHFRDVVNTRDVYVSENGGKIKLRLLIDKYSAEVFVNDGEQAITSLIYTDQAANEISFQSDRKTSISVIKYEIATKYLR